MADNLNDNGKLVLRDDPGSNRVLVVADFDGVQVPIFQLSGGRLSKYQAQAEQRKADKTAAGKSK